MMDPRDIDRHVWAFRATFKALDYVWDDHFNIVGVRSANKRAGEFDDSIWLFHRSSDRDPWQVERYAATCDPGPKYLKRPIHRAGCGALVPGQYKDCYKIGWHRGQYKALVQAGGPVKVYRDNNRDSILDYNPKSIMTGFFGINIHRAGRSYIFGQLFKAISAACQVLADMIDFDDFMMLCEAERQRRKKNSFTYTLLTHRQIASGMINAPPTGAL